MSWLQTKNILLGSTYWRRIFIIRCLWVTHCTCATTGDKIPLPSLILTTQRKKRLSLAAITPLAWESEIEMMEVWRERFRMWRHLLLCGIESVIHTPTERLTQTALLLFFLFVTMRALSPQPIPFEQQICSHFHAHFPFSHAVVWYVKYKSCFLSFMERGKIALMKQTCSGIWRKSLWLFSIP